MLVLENDHTSPVLEWIGRAEAQGFTVETVAQPADGDWTSAVLEAIERPGATPLSLASISSIHWSDGGLLDMQKIRDALRRHGAALLVDATHGVGVIATDVKTLDPDFLIFPTYKWVLGPYGRAFVYVAKRHQDGMPLEQTSFGRRNVKAENPVYFSDTRYLPDARRYDMGERDHFISMEMAAIGMEMMAAWGADAVAQRLSALTRRIADGLAGVNGRTPPRRALPRAAYLCVSGFSGTAASTHSGARTKEQVYVAARLGRMRDVASRVQRRSRCRSLRCRNEALTGRDKAAVTARRPERAGAYRDPSMLTRRALDRGLRLGCRARARVRPSHRTIRRSPSASSYRMRRAARRTF